jgi:hypothetical protein
VAQVLQRVLGQQIRHLDILLDAQEHNIRVQLGDGILKLVLLQSLGAKLAMRQIIREHNVQVEGNQIDKLNGVCQARKNGMLVDELVGRRY